MIKAKVIEGKVDIKLKGTSIDLLAELQTLNLNVLEEIAKSSNINANQLTKEMSRILIEFIEERGDE